MNPTVAKMAGQIALSLVRSRTGRRVLIAVLVLQLIALTVILWLPTYFASITATSIQRVITTAPSNCGAETAPTITGDGGAGAAGPRPAAAPGRRSPGPST